MPASCLASVLSSSALLCQRTLTVDSARTALTAEMGHSRLDRAASSCPQFAHNGPPGMSDFGPATGAQADIRRRQTSRFMGTCPSTIYRGPVLPVRQGLGCVGQDRKRHVACAPCANCPSCQFVAAFGLALSGKSQRCFRPSRAHKRGGSRSSRTSGTGRDGRTSPGAIFCATSGVCADGEVAWSWRSDAGAKFVKRFRAPRG
jgi:hypothetical protein